MTSSAPRRRAAIAYFAAIATLGSLMTIVALGGGVFSVKKPASEFSQAQMTILNER